MANKKLFFYLLGGLIIAMVGILFYLSLTVSHTSAVITVVQKGYSEDSGEAFIIATPPNSSNELYEVKIAVKEPLVWNLIGVNDTYSANYVNQHNESILKYISNIGDDKALEDFYSNN